MGSSIIRRNIDGAQVEELSRAQILGQALCCSAKKSELTWIFELFPEKFPSSLKRQVEKDLEIRLRYKCSRVGALGHLHLRLIPMGHCPPSVGTKIAWRKKKKTISCRNVFPWNTLAASVFLLKTTSCYTNEENKWRVSRYESYLEKEAEADPLIVLHVLLVSLVPRLVHPWVGHVHPNPLPVGGGEGVGGVDPAVRVQHLFRDVLRVDAHDCRADVLPRRHDEGEGEQDHNGRPVMESKYTTVRVETANFH